jgi:hypothetical protein
MKIAIYTQIEENYGAHDWDGKGSCPQGWKMKGGNTYIIDMVSVEQAVDSDFWDAATQAITSNSNYFLEYVIGSDLLDDCEAVTMDPWESAIHIGPDVMSDAWLALQTQVNGEYNHLAPEVAKKYSAWKLVNGEQKDFECSLEFTNGKILPWAEACEYLSELRAAA